MEQDYWTHSCVLVVGEKIIHMGQTENLLKDVKSFLPIGVHLKGAYSEQLELLFDVCWTGISKLSHLCSISLPPLFFWAAKHKVSLPATAHTHAIRFSTSKPSIKTGCGRGFGGKRWDTYPKRFYISWPLDSVRRHSGPACFLSVRIKSSLSHESAKKNLKKEFKNLRCLPPGPVCASPQEYRGNFCLAQIISIYCFHWAHFH